MSCKIIPKKKKRVSSNLFLSNESFHRFEQHIIFKLMTYCFHNSIASTATDNDLLILKQRKGFSFFKIYFSEGLAAEELSYRQNGRNNFMRLYMGKCRGKIWYTSPLRSCQRHGEPESWVGKGE